MGWCRIHTAIKRDVFILENYAVVRSLRWWESVRKGVRKDIAILFDKIFVEIRKVFMLHKRIWRYNTIKFCEIFKELSRWKILEQESSKILDSLYATRLFFLNLTLWLWRYEDLSVSSLSSMMPYKYMCGRTKLMGKKIKKETNSVARFLKDKGRHPTITYSMPSGWSQHNRPFPHAHLCPTPRLNANPTPLERTRRRVAASTPPRTSTPRPGSLNLHRYSQRGASRTPSHPRDGIQCLGSKFNPLETEIAPVRKIAINPEMINV